MESRLAVNGKVPRSERDGAIDSLGIQNGAIDRDLLVKGLILDE